MHSGSGDGLLRSGSHSAAEADGGGGVSGVTPSRSHSRAPLKQVLSASLSQLAEGARVNGADALGGREVGGVAGATPGSCLEGGVCAEIAELMEAGPAVAVKDELRSAAGAPGLRALVLGGSDPHVCHVRTVAACALVREMIPLARGSLGGQRRIASEEGASDVVGSSEVPRARDGRELAAVERPPAASGSVGGAIWRDGGSGQRSKRRRTRTGRQL